MANDPILSKAVVHFRAHLSAAPLKIRSRFAAASAGRDFRAHLSAAPLKIMRFPLMRADRTVFPRSSERGPIEDGYRTIRGQQGVAISALI